MTALSKCLPLALLLTLTSCASLGSKPPGYLPPRIDCAEYDAPRKKMPADVAPSERSVVIWQLHAYAWKDYAESVLEQRIATAVCMEGNRRSGAIQ